MPFEEQTVSIFAGTSGYIDDVPVDAVTRYEAAMLADMRANHAGVLKDIRDKRDLSDDTKGKLKDAPAAFAKPLAQGACGLPHLHTPPELVSGPIVQQPTSERMAEGL